MITNRTYGMDADVISYNARIVAGGNQSLSMQSLRQLNQFVISIKKIGLWYNIVCWPLRANQNADAGAIAYSLGGLGIYNGTIFNNPTRQPNGLYFESARSQLINTTFASNIGINNFGLFCCADFSETQLAPNGYGIVVANRDIFGSGAVKGMAIGTTTTTNTRLQLGNGTTNFTQNTTKISSFTCYSQLSNGSNTIQSENNRILASNAPVLSGPFVGSDIQIGVQLSNQNYFQGRISFVMGVFGIANNSSIYSLYKSTLGQDLGLP